MAAPWAGGTFACGAVARPAWPWLRQQAAPRTGTGGISGAGGWSNARADQLLLVTFSTAGRSDAESTTVIAISQRARAVANMILRRSGGSGGAIFVVPEAQP